MNDFARSSLSIAPAAKLMSAKAFVNPDEVYGQGNEWIRLAESLKGISAQGDKLADEFIEKQKSKAKAQAEKDLLNMMRTGDKNVEEYLKEQKRQVSKFNTLGTSFWTREYLAKGMAENLLAKKKATLEQDYINKGYANLSVEEYNKRLSDDVLNFDKDLENYDEDTRHYYESMPNKELFAIMQERHIRNVNEKNLALRDTIAENKFKDTLRNTTDGLMAVTIDDKQTPLTDVPYGELTPELQSKLKNATALYEKVSGRKVGVGHNGLIQDIAAADDISKIAMLTDSPIVNNLVGLMRETGRAGMTPQETKERLMAALKAEVMEEPELADMAEALLIVTLNKANSDKELQAAYNSWGHTDNNNMLGDEDIALFSLAEAKELSNEIISTGINQQALIEQNRKVKEFRDYEDGMDFLKDALNAGKLTRKDLERLTPQQIADKLKLDYDSFGQAIVDYQEARVKGYTTPKTESHLRSYNYYLEGIRTGKIKDKQEIIDAYHSRNIHPSDYERLLNEFDNNTGETGAKTNSLLNAGLKYVFGDIDIKIGAVEPDRANNLKSNIEDALRKAIVDGKVTDELEAAEFAKKYYQTVAQFEIGAGTYSNLAKPTVNDLQLKEQTAESIVQGATKAERDENGKLTQPQLYLTPGVTEADFLGSDSAKILREVGVSEEQLRQAYAKSKESSGAYREEKWDDHLTSMLKGDTLTEENLLKIYNKNPKVLEKEFGFEFKVVDGRVLPKDEKIGKFYLHNLKKGMTVKNALDVTKFQKRRDGLWF